MISIVIEKRLSIEQADYLNQHFLNLFSPTQSSLDAKLLYQELVRNYSQEHRSYHNLSHIFSMLQLATQFEILEPQLLYSAIWYHDIIYKSTRKDNEAKSAEYAANVLANLLGPARTKALKLFINSTAKHQPLMEFEDNLLLLDLDLAVLATDRDTYKKYKDAIRAEYNIYPDLLYKPGRKKVLNHFLKREKIYYTQPFILDYERIARDNLKWELSLL